MKRPPATRPRYQALLQLLRTSEMIWNASRAFFARWELGPSQFNILNALAGRPGGCTQMELSRELVTHRSNVTGLISRLEQRGLIRRRDAVADRRAYRVTLTPAGRKLVAKILPHYHHAAEQVWGKVSSAHVQQLVAALETLACNAERIVHDPKKDVPSQNTAHP